MSTEIYEAAMAAILKGDTEAATAVAEKGLNEGIDPVMLINSGFIPAISEVGEQFGSGRLFLPELMKAAKAMQAATDIINKALPENETQTSGRIIIGTVEGDVHDIGKTIVISLLKANGFDVKDLGRDVRVDRIIDEAEKFDAQIIGTSALLTTTMPRQKELEEVLESRGLKERFKTIVGGAPVTTRWAKRIGADGYAENATEAVKLAKTLLAA